MVIVWSVDRLGRSLQDLVGFRSKLHAQLLLRQQGLDTTTPAFFVPDIFVIASVCFHRHRMTGQWQDEII